MKAAVWYKKRDVRIEDLPEPVPGKGEVKVRIKWCGICGSDLHEYLDGPISIPVDAPHPLTGKTAPVTIGHEFAGEITEVGPDVTKFKVGDRVISETTLACMECPECLAGNYSHCRNLGILGISGFGGGLAEYTVAKELFLHKIPDEMGFERAAIVEPLSVGFHSLTVGKFVPGMTAVVLGAGPIALGVIESLRACGAKTIIAVVRKSIRQEYALRSGADLVLDPNEVDAAAEIRRITGDLGADICFETYGSELGPKIGQECLRSGGTLVIISLWSKPVPVDLMATVQGEYTIVGSNLFTYNDFETVKTMLCDGRIKAEGYITGRIALDDLLEEGFGALSGPDSKKHIKIIVTPDRSLL